MVQINKKKIILLIATLICILITVDLSIIRRKGTFCDGVFLGELKFVLNFNKQIKITDSEKQYYIMNPNAEIEICTFKFKRMIFFKRVSTVYFKFTDEISESKLMDILKQYGINNFNLQTSLNVNNLDSTAVFNIDLKENRSRNMSLTLFY